MNDNIKIPSEEKLLWERETQGNPFRPSAYISVMNDEGVDAITICVGGKCVTKSIEDWGKIATLFSRVIVKDTDKAQPTEGKEQPLSTEEMDDLNNLGFIL